MLLLLLAFMYEICFINKFALCPLTECILSFLKDKITAAMTTVHSCKILSHGYYKPLCGDLVSD